MLPRIALFRADRMNINHLVMVDGDILKPLCIRTPIKHGHLLDSDGKLTCENCRNRGWTKTLGRIGTLPARTDTHGRYIARQTHTL